MQDLDHRPTWRVTRAGVAYVFGLTAEGVADLESRGVLVFETDDHIDLAEAAARIYAEARLVQTDALSMVLAASKLITELTHRMNAMWAVLSDANPSREAMLESVVDTAANYQRIIDELAAVITTPMGSPQRVRPEEVSPCVLN